MPNSPIIQAFLPSDNKAILSPLFTPNFNKPAATICACCLVSK